MSSITATTLPRFSTMGQAPQNDFSFDQRSSVDDGRPRPVTCSRASKVRQSNERTAVVPETSRFLLQSATDFAGVSPARWTVKGILPERGLGMVYGAPGAGKSFLLLDMACAIAGGVPWSGRKTRRAPVVYLCLEGASGFAKRILAWERANSQKAPGIFKVISQDIHLHNLEDMAVLSQTILAWVGSLSPDLARPVIVIDTLNRAMPGCDENGPADMGRSLEGCAALQKACGGLVLLAHHNGKDPSKGSRGHTSLHGALDASLVLWRSGKCRNWKIDKMKDGEDDIHGKFDLIQVPLGEDEDGDPVTSCVVQALETCPLEKDVPILSAQLKLALSTLGAAVGVSSLSVDVQLDLGSWRTLFYPACPAPSDSGKRNAFARARKELLEAGFTIESGQAISITAAGIAQINSLVKADVNS